MMTKSHREALILDHMPQVEPSRRLHRRCPHVELDNLISAGTMVSSRLSTDSIHRGI